MNVERSVPPTESAKQAPQSKPWEPTAKYVLLVVAVLGALAIYGSVSRERAELHAVASMPADARRPLYDRVLENLRFCKAQSNPALERFCKGEAEFIVTFPECRAECKDLGRRFVSAPVR